MAKANAVAMATHSKCILRANAKPNNSTKRQSVPCN